MSFHSLTFKFLTNRQVRAILVCLFLIGLCSCKKDSYSDYPVSSELAEVTPLEGVAALGQLSPRGEIRSLASPVSSSGGTPRVSKILIKEGDFVKNGQVLVVFESQKRIQADLAEIKAKLETINKKINMQRKEVSRYQEAANQGAYPLVLLEEKQD